MNSKKSVSLNPRWTISAIDCYLRGCVCEGCPMKKFMETNCRMKVTVIKLVEKFGKPNVEKEEESFYEE